MLASFSEAFSITVVDSVLVTRTHGQSLDYAAGLQSFCWGLQVTPPVTCYYPLHAGERDPCQICAAAQAVGKVVSAGVVGVMIAHVRPRACFMIIAALPLLIACSSFVMREDRIGGWCCGQGARLLPTGMRHANRIGCDVHS